MAKQYLSVNQFRGIRKSGQFIIPITDNSGTAGYFNRLYNFKGELDYNSLFSTSGYPGIGMITKSPAWHNYKAVMPAAGRSRGIWQYIPNIPSIATSNFLMTFQCTTDYTVNTLYALNIPTNTWYTLAVGGAVSYHGDAVQYKDRFYLMTAGLIQFVKWNGDIVNWNNIAPPVQDKGGTWTNVAGATLTWNGTATVTSDIDISGILYRGTYIRRSSTSIYEDEVLNINGAGTTITLSSASSDNGASAAGGSQYPPTANSTIGTAFFVHAWKNKLWVTGNNNILFWSVSNDAENWSGLGAGSIITGESDDDFPSGIASFDDFLFVFKDLQHFIYRWTGDVDQPIELVKTVNYGCVSQRTIQNVGNALIYYTGNDVRMTNGSEDVSIGFPDIDDFLIKFAGNRHYTYFSSAAADNAYPWAYYDKTKEVYSLYFPTTTTYAYSMHYSFKKKTWISEEEYQILGHGTGVVESSISENLVCSTSTATNQLIYTPPVNDVTDFTVVGAIESIIFNSGISSKKLKIHWVELGVHPNKAGKCDTTVSFNYKLDNYDADATKAKTANINSGSPFTYTYGEVHRHRFEVNTVSNLFQWILTETAFGVTADTDWTLADYTICYELIENT